MSQDIIAVAGSEKWGGFIRIYMLRKSEYSVGEVP